MIDDFGIFNAMPHFPTLILQGRIYPKINKAEALGCLLICPAQGLGATMSFVFTICILFFKEDPAPVVQTSGPIRPECIPAPCQQFPYFSQTLQWPLWKLLHPNP